MLRRCEITRNPCGTDTWAAESPCPCPQCQRWLVAEVERLQRDAATLTTERDEARENANFLRESVGECHVMISRDAEAFQLQHDWDSLSLPWRVRTIMQQLHKSTATQAALAEAALAFVTKVSALTPAINEAFAFQANHGIPYTGDSWQNEEHALETTLAAPTAAGRALLAEITGLRARVERTERAFMDASRFIPTHEAISINADTNALALEILSRSLPTGGA